MSQQFSNHLNNYSYDNFIPQATKDRNLNVFLTVAAVGVGVVLVYIIVNAIEEEKKLKDEMSSCKIKFSAN
jgi:hypothetical protein